MLFRSVNSITLNKYRSCYHSVTQLCDSLLSATLWTVVRQASLSFTISWSLLKLMSIKSLMPFTVSSSAAPFSSFPQFFPASEPFPMSRLIRIWWRKYWSFSFSISPSNEYSVLISFRIDWFDSLMSKGLSRVFSSTTV